MNENDFGICMHVPGMTTLIGGTQGKCLSSKQQTNLITFVLLCDEESRDILNFWSRRAISPCKTCGISVLELLAAE